MTSLLNLLEYHLQVYLRPELCCIIGCTNAASAIKKQRVYMNEVVGAQPQKTGLIWVISNLIL